MREPTVNSGIMSAALRCGHLPQVFRDLVRRLGAFKSLGSKELESPSAKEHGATRRRQG